MLGGSNLFEMVDSSYISFGTSISRKPDFTVIYRPLLHIGSHQISMSEIE